MTTTVYKKTLTILHQIYLTPEQREALVERRESVEVVGVSVPVWFESGNSSEPAQEVFVKYTLTNRLENHGVVTSKDGYTINLPQPKPTEQDAEIKQMFSNFDTPRPKIMPTRNLLESGWLIFKQFQHVKQETRVLNVLHYIEMRDREYLEDSLTLPGHSEEKTPSAC